MASACRRLASGSAATWPAAEAALDEVLAPGAEVRARCRRPWRWPSSSCAEGACQAHIAACLGVSTATVGRVLKRAGLSRLSDLRPAEPVQRYEHEQPGELLHIDIKKLGRFEKVGSPHHRRSRHRRARRLGDMFVAVDDHGRLAFTRMYPDESKHSAEAFLRNGGGLLRRLGVPIQRVLTDNGKSFRSTLSPRRAGTGHQPEVHPRVPAANQRQGRALHPVGPAGVGLRTALPTRPASRPAASLEPLLQLAQAAPRHQRCRPYVPTQLVPKQRLDASQLDGGR